MKLLSTKIFIGNLLVIILLTGLILFFTFQTTWSHYYERIASDMTHTNVVFIDNIIELVAKADHKELQKVVKSTGDATGVRVTIIDTNGVVIAESKYNPAEMDNHYNRPEVRKAFQSGSAVELRYSYTLEDEMLYVASPIVYNTQILGVSRLSLFVKDIDELTNRLTYDILKISLIVVLFSMVGVLIFSRNITRPINHLSHAARSVAAGDFDVKVLLKGRDEISELASNFNHMTERLKNLFMQVNSQKDEYLTLISSIQEGLIVLNTKGKILLYNGSMKKIMENEKLSGKFYWEVISEPSFAEFFNSSVQSRKAQTKEIQYNKKYFLCSSNIVGSKNEIVILFHDITEIKSLEKIKRDFVINVSHELKTPLTAIKGFAETLEDEMDNDDHIHYLNIINRHTDRLINIVRDLLILSELEKEDTTLILNKVSLQEMIANVIVIFEQKLKEKNLSLEYTIQDDFPKINVDVFRFEQVIVNLIDNGIKYTDEGGVKLNAFIEEENAIIEVIDTGVGISKEDQKRIFERFYIVDKSRSKKVGGTGLGLSIVKHIINLHNGDIRIESQKGVGTKFTITLPLNISKENQYKALS